MDCMSYPYNFVIFLVVQGKYLVPPQSDSVCLSDVIYPSYETNLRLTILFSYLDYKTNSPVIGQGNQMLLLPTLSPHNIY